MADQTTLQLMSIHLTEVGIFVSFISGVGILALGYFQYQLAKRVHQINQQRLKMDLFDHRFAIYKAIEDFLLYIESKANMHDDVMRKYLVETNNATFLFEIYTAEYIER